MMTLRFLTNLVHIPIGTARYLTDLAGAMGRLQHLTQGAPQRLKALHEQAIAESALSSGRIESMAFDSLGLRELVFGWPPPRDRREVEVRRYRDALELVHGYSVGSSGGSSGGSSDRPPVSEETVLELHRLLLGQADEAGQYRQEDLEILEKGRDGRARRLMTVPAREVPEAMGELLELWNRFGNRTIPQLLALVAFNLDFLNIHPFRAGTGRVARLLFVLQCTHLGNDVVRYVSIERILERNKERYYDTLEEASRGWQRGSYNSWPYVDYMLSILKEAYGELEEQIGRIGARRGEKSEVVLAAVNRMPGEFTVADLLEQCPGAGADLVRHILQTLRLSGAAECLGRGRSARWRRAGRAE